MFPSARLLIYGLFSIEESWALFELSSLNGLLKGICKNLSVFHFRASMGWVCGVGLELLLKYRDINCGFSKEILVVCVCRF